MTPEGEADDGFDEDLYLATNPDLAEAFRRGLIESGAAHWRDAGAAETGAGRRPTLLEAARDPANPTPFLTEDAVAEAAARMGAFDAAAYLAMNPDLAQAFGADEEAARRHRVQHGRLEGRYAPGDAPYRDRDVSLDAVFARPFGVDLHMPARGIGAAGVAGRQMLAALRAAGIPFSIRPFSDNERAPRLPLATVCRPGTHRIALVVATSPSFRKLLRLYPADYWNASFVIACWPEWGLAPHLPDYPLFGAVDEVWVPTAHGRRMLASVAPVAVRQVALPPARLAPKAEARRVLGLRADAFALAIDGNPVESGTGDLRLPDGVEEAIARFRRDASGDPSRLLVVRSRASLAKLLDEALRGLPNAVVRADPPRGGEGSLVFAACDAVLSTTSIAHEIAGHEERLRPVRRRELARLLATGARPAPPPTARTLSAAAAGARIRATFAELGLDIRRPAFAAAIGRARDAAIPRVGEGQTRPALSLPILSLLLDGARLDGARIPAAALDELLAALAAQPHPFWELCVAGWRPTAADRAEGARARHRADPRLRLVPDEDAPYDALGRAGSAATGTFLLPVHGIEDAQARIASLEAIARAVSADPAPDLLLRTDPAASRTDLVDTLEAGGPASDPVAVRRLFVREGAASEETDPFRFALAAARAGAVIRTVDIGAATALAVPPTREEERRTALLSHARTKLGPAAFVEPGLVAGTFRLRRHRAAGIPIAVCRLDEAVPASSSSAAADRLAACLAAARAEYVVLLWGGTQPDTPDAVPALAELLLDAGIGAVGGAIMHPDGTLLGSGLVEAPAARPKAEGEAEADAGARPSPGTLVPALPPELPGLGTSADAASRVRNVDGLDGGCLALRRSSLLALGRVKPDAGREGGGHQPEDALARAICRRLREERRLRIVWTPFARFVRADEAPRPPA